MITTRPHYMFLDVETTGLDCDVDEITELAYVFDDSTQHQFFVEHTRLPHRHILTKMDYVSRIMLAPKTPLAAVLLAMCQDCAVISHDRLERVYLVGANPAFDHGFIKQAFRKALPHYALPYFFRLIDIETLVAGRLALREPPALKEIRELLGIPGANQNAHTALSDALEVKLAWDKLAENFRPLSRIRPVQPARPLVGDERAVSMTEYAGVMTRRGVNDAGEISAALYECNDQRCSPPLSDAELYYIVRDVLSAAENK